MFCGLQAARFPRQLAPRGAPLHPKEAGKFGTNATQTMDVDRHYEHHMHSQRQQHLQAKLEQLFYVGCRQRVSPDSQHPGVSRYSQKKQAKQERRRKLKKYYQKGATSGEPATCMLYKLAERLHVKDNHLLW